MADLFEIRAKFAAMFPTVDIVYTRHLGFTNTRYTVSLYGQDTRLEGNDYDSGDDLDAFVSRVKAAWEDLVGVTPTIEVAQDSPMIAMNREPFVRQNACARGHTYTKETVYVDKRGCRHCRKCNVIRTRNFRDKNR